LRKLIAISKILFYFVLKFVWVTMEQIRDNLKNALCSGVKPPVVRQPLFTQTAPDIEFLTQFFSSLIISRVIQNRGGYGILNMKCAGLPALHEKHNVWNVIAKAVVKRFVGLQVCSEESFS
jgi:hypothetical protein